jgi:hypothetical protein
LRAYFLVRGTIVKGVDQEPASSLAEVKLAGVNPKRWPPSRFLSTRPMPDANGTIETPIGGGLRRADGAPAG